MSKLQQAMLSLLQNSKGHFTAEQILAKLREDYPTASLATVYRTLDIFTREGKIRRVSFADSPKFYESNMIPHDHAVCLHCGRVSDLTVPGLAKLVAENIQGEVVSLDLNVNCICADCSSRANEVKPYGKG
jgi:Fe2+ or Zn2+ uptake regulation protein